MFNIPWLRAIGLCCFVGCTGTTGAHAQLNIVDPAGQGEVMLGGGSGGGLSGIAHVTGNQFLSVADSGGLMFDTAIDIDLSTGLITGAPAIGSSVMLTGGADVEGAAYDPTDDTVIISDETGPAVRRHNPDGSPVANIALPAVYANIRTNFSLESVARQANGDLWTANEEALSGDGPLASLAAGSAVRISNLSAGGQWAYVTDPVRANTGPQFSGVSALVALPDGTLLVLEREASFGFRNRIYAVDVSTGTGVSATAMLDSDGDNDLADEPWTAVEKTMLWEGLFLLTNFEGMTLGPQLNNGDHTLLLVSDDDQGLPQNLYILHLQGVMPAPTLLGDANNDGQVTGADLIAVQQNFGNTGPADGLLPGDANDDGQVTGADLIAVQQNFGNTLPPAGTPVPEPAALMIGAGAPLLILRPR